MDRKPGHLTKVKGVLKALSYHATINLQKIPINWKPSFARTIIPRIPLMPVEICLGSKIFHPIDLIISAGGYTEWANAKLAHKYNIPNIFIGSNRICKPTEFTILPRLTPSNLPNVITLDYMPSEFDATMIQESATAELPCMTGRYWTLLIGGDGSGCIWSLDDHKKHAINLIEASRSAGVKIVAVSSRRTGHKQEQVWSKLLQDSNQLALGVWHSQKNNSPHPSIAALMGIAEIIIVTEDSSSMISEAVATGRAVATISPEKTGPDSKQENMLNRLAEIQMLTRLPISHWNSSNIPSITNTKTENNCLKSLGARLISEIQEHHRIK
jgi:mitochondrial fission protein ELM1